MGTDNGKKIPSNYFLYPEFMAFVLLPVTWGLLPIAGFFPKALSPFLPVIFLWISPIDTLIKFQVRLSQESGVLVAKLNLTLCFIKANQAKNTPDHLFVSD